MQHTHKTRKRCSTRFALVLASAMIVGAPLVNSAHAADEVPGMVCSGMLPLQNGGPIYLTNEQISYAQKMELNNGADKHIIIARNNISKRVVLIRNGKTIDWNRM